MDSRDVRAKYLAFFKSAPRNHQAIPPSPLVPQDDPTTLFTGSGMQQLVPYLKGQPHPMGTRLVDSQPSFRAEDIEEIGDNRHTTFFEMLGNWSLGDYFKKEQLPWFFEFLTQGVGLDPKRLSVTVFEGDKIVPKDEESIKIWQELFKTKAAAQSGAAGFDPQTKIYLYSAKKNWWSRAGEPGKMPVGEIGGPDSEVFYDFGPELKLHENSVFKDKPCHVNCDCGRFLEIGNSVFMEYVKTETGFEPLPKKNVDFGGGLERITAASQNQPDIFQTDFFSEAIKTLESLKQTGGNYDTNPKPYRIIVDHLRGAAFMAAEGVEPENKGRGYILRRLLRRSVVYARQLGLEDTEWLKETLSLVADPYAQVYPEVTEKIPQISERLTQEVDKFRKTVDKGMRLLERYRKVDGKVAFDLFQTYGFPLEITEELLAQKGQQVNREEFEKEFEKHKQLSRTASAGMFKGGLADKSEEVTKLHTATHLLHKALREVLGDHIGQVGSNITAERLRFDFTHPQAMTQEEIQQVEAIVNEKIKANLPVHKTTEDKQAALASGALAFFPEKYPGKVTVYTIGKDPQKNWWSRELCGGPHVATTREIGGVTIEKETAVGTGKRRIYAVLNERIRNSKSEAPNKLETRNSKF
jgi:alanyl-tRNA synthetase